MMDPSSKQVRNLGRVVAQIPARAGSKRCPAKNLRMLGGKPMVAYAVECAKASGVFDEIYLNTDSPELAALAESLGVNVFHRAAHLASDSATGDDFNADFMQKTGAETVVMVSPVCPLVDADDVREALTTYRDHPSADTLITCTETRLQTFCQGRPVNIDDRLPLAPSQQNPAVQILNWAVTIWNSDVFLASYARNRSGYLGTERLLMPIDPLHAIKVSYEADFRLVERILLGQRHADMSERPSYWSRRGIVTAPIAPDATPTQ